MYDFLLLTPHNCASHSLTYYLNQHPELHVAPSVSIQRSMDDVGAYERHVRPWFRKVGIGSKTYSSPDVVTAILAATERQVCVFVFRDPLESFVSNAKNVQLFGTLKRHLGREPQILDIDREIQEALANYISFGAAARAYDLESFERVIAIDIEDLKGSSATVTVGYLWRQLVGHDDVPDAVFEPMGAKPYHALREFCSFRVQAHDHVISTRGRYDGDLWHGLFSPLKKSFVGHEECLHTFPDAMAVLPAFGVRGRLNVCVLSRDWSAFLPDIRKQLKPRVISTFLEQAALLNRAYEDGTRAMTFTLDQLTTKQADTLRRGLEEDLVTIFALYPEIAQKWSTTRAFLGL